MTFSYHAMVSSFCEALIPSMSPSPSTSAPNTEYAPSASVEITRRVHKDPSPFTFSYHAMVSS